MKDIAVNLRRVPMIFYILSTLICFVFMLLSTSYFADDPADNQSMLIYMIRGGNSLSGLNMWHNTLSSSDMNTWLLILTPLICCVGYVYSFNIEISTRCYLSSLNRQGLRRFMMSRFFGCGIYSSIIMFSALVLTLLTATLYSHELGNYSEAPITEMLIHRNSVVLALSEVTLTYICYAFIVGIICLTLSAIISNAFTSCSTLVLILFLMGDIQSSYHSKFLKKMFSGECSPDEYNHFTDFLFVGNIAHGMPEFQNDFQIPYVLYLVIVVFIIMMIYLVFYTVMKKKVIL